MVGFEYSFFIVLHKDFASYNAKPQSFYLDLSVPLRLNIKITY